MPDGSVDGAYGQRAFLRGYTLIRGIGVDRAGALIEATDDATGAPVVVRVLSPALVADARVLRDVARSVDRLRPLRHPHLVAVIAFDARANALVSASVRGTTLRHLLDASGPLDLAATLVLLDGCLSGLEALHDVRVLHRDVRPGAVMIDVDGNVLLRDAGVPAPALRAGWREGTPQYMAPELWAGRPHSVATDLYAVTAVFFEAVTGRAPFTATELSALRQQHERAGVAEAAVPLVARSIVVEGLAKTPRQRPSSARSLRLDLDMAASSFLGEGWREHGRLWLADVARARLDDPVPLEPLPPPVVDDDEEDMAAAAVPAAAAIDIGRQRLGWRVWAAVTASVLALLVVLVVAAHALNAPSDASSPTPPVAPASTDTSGPQASPTTYASMPGSSDTTSPLLTDAPVPTQATAFPTSTQSISFAPVTTPTESPSGSPTPTPTPTPTPRPTPTFCLLCTPAP